MHPFARREKSGFLHLFGRIRNAPGEVMMTSVPSSETQGGRHLPDAFRKRLMQRGLVIFAIAGEWQAMAGIALSRWPPFCLLTDATGLESIHWPSGFYRAAWR